MPFQPVPNAAQITVKAKLDGEDCDTTLGFGKIVPGTVTPGELQVLCNAVANIWSAAFITQLPVKYVCGKVMARVLDVQDGPMAENTTNIGTLGDIVGNILPNNVTLAIAFLTGLSGRTNRGRNFWPSFVEAEVTDQRVLQAKVDSIIGLYDGNLLGAGTLVAGWTWSVISRKMLVPLGPGRAVPITAVTVNDLVVDSQRRRLPERGS